MKNQWTNVKDGLPLKDTPVNVIVQETLGGIPRNQYHLEIAFITDNMCFKNYWSVKSGIVKCWQPIDLPNTFKKITTNSYELGEKYEQN